MIKTLSIAVAAAVAVLLLYAAARPDSFRVERSVRIRATPEQIFPYIVDLRRFNTWNPFARKDPALSGQYGAVTVGNGASYAWTSDRIGSGRMEITGFDQPSQVTMKLDFLKPFEAHNVAEFTLRPDGDATVVTWAMHGQSPYLGRLVQVFFSMDKMVGGDFEAGLGNLKALAQAH
ncbi:SRPBCC family protein [Burkholderia alba]|uniref:SRPBCC family protein n=1 Tax=Burkholderia alba TaxID=2683677 RepID=UPI002B061B24|nr:SRPBCC family protein [Burkholderia alba]